MQGTLISNINGDLGEVMKMVGIRVQKKKRFLCCIKMEPLRQEVAGKTQSNFENNNREMKEVCKTWNLLRWFAQKMIE